VPEARSVSEKMQMRGDAVTLSGIDNSLRATAFEGDGAAGAGLWNGVTGGSSSNIKGADSTVGSYDVSKP